MQAEFATVERTPLPLERATSDIIPSSADITAGEGMPLSTGVISEGVEQPKQEVTREITQSLVQRLVRNTPSSAETIKSIPSSLEATSQCTQDVFSSRTALVLYGSETGNSQDVAEEMGDLTERLRFNTQVSELNSITVVCSCLCSFNANLISLSADTDMLSETTPPAFRCPHSHLHYWTRRSAGQCSSVLENAEECTPTARMLAFRAIYILWPWRHFISKVSLYGRLFQRRELIHNKVQLGSSKTIQSSRPAWGAANL